MSLVVSARPLLSAKFRECVIRVLADLPARPRSYSQRKYRIAMNPKMTA
jgi:hypothetical protein